MPNTSKGVGVSKYSIKNHQESSSWMQVCIQWISCQQQDLEPNHAEIIPWSEIRVSFYTSNFAEYCGKVETPLQPSEFRPISFPSKQPYLIVVQLLCFDDYFTQLSVVTDLMLGMRFSFILESPQTSVFFHQSFT